MNGAAASAGLRFLDGGGEMGRLLRAHDWSRTSLGPPQTWPQPLRTALRMLLNSGHPMYIWWGPEFICFYNDAYRPSIGADRHPGSLGRPAREVWAEIWPIIGPQIDQVMSGHGATWNENQLVPISRNGRVDEVYWTYSYNPIDDESSPTGVGGVLVICTETTGQVLAQRNMRAADRRKDEFLATLAHELRNPLAPVRNAAKVLRLPGADSKTRELATTIIDRQIEAMAGLLDDLLDVSKITEGQIDLHRQRTSVAAIIETSLEVARPLIEVRRHQLTVSLPPEPIEVDVDPLRLSQVFSNLLTNAAKYTEPGGHIDLIAQAEDGGVSITVRDTGVGLEPESIAQIFEIFSQVKSTLQHAAGGLGIGLALVKGLVALHGGRVSAASAGPGRGSEFCVWLPACAVSAGAPAHAEPARPASSVKKRRILVVDDNEDAAQSLGFLLELAGHEPYIAHDGEQAVAMASDLKPDIALVDIGLPKLNGYGVAQSIRAAPWGARMVLIALTGWGQDEDKRRALEAGFDYHLTKPVDPDQVETLIANLETRGRGIRSDAPFG
jgi:signal transduction histidine kinase/CheY-like chemotaxis protein